PIWHGQAPRIISTFLESYDFSGKTIVPFCTSHSSGIGSSDTNLHSLAPSAEWVEGRRFPSGTSQQTVADWIESLNLKPTADVSAFDLKSGKNGSAPTVTLNSGYEMPIVRLGTYSLQGETCRQSVLSALSQGYRLIDTAHMYGNEREIGEAIRQSGVPREEIFVITKIYPGEQFANPEKAIRESLDKLNIGYVDMMLLHHPGANDVKAYLAIEKFVEQGKIRSIGLSNWYIEEIDDFISKVNITPALIQNEIHPYYQEQTVVPYMHNLGIVMQAWYPLGGRGHTGALLSDNTITQIAKSRNKSAAQIILRWHLQRGVVVIPGSSNPAHILENISIFDFELSDSEMNAIAALERNEKHDWY
ncbi:MAG: aldo/keto reductase, partial [Clostridia bacterium]|nr:aldo/keto reductase [Clostridia bacterium]